MTNLLKIFLLYRLLENVLSQKYLNNFYLLISYKTTRTLKQKKEIIIP